MNRILYILFFLLLGFFSVHANVEPGEYGLIVTPLSDVDTIYEDFNLFYEDSIYSKQENTAEYPDGRKGLMRYFKENLKYPAPCFEAGVQGKVIVKFTVTKEGNIRDIKLIRGVYERLENEVIRVIKNMKEWIPGEANQEFTLSVLFKIPDFDEKGVCLLVTTSASYYYKEVDKIIYKNLKYPKKAKKDKIEGRCRFKFILESDGKIKDVEIIDSVSPEIDQEAIRLIKLTEGQWIPSKYNGENVRSYVRYSVNFKLNYKYKRSSERKRSAYHVAASS
jgi:TonB family protein